MQIKTTLRYDLIPIRMVRIKKTVSVDKDVEKKEPVCIAGGMYIGASTVENMCMCGVKIYEKSLYRHLNFVVSLKML